MIGFRSLPLAQSPRRFGDVIADRGPTAAEATTERPAEDRVLDGYPSTAKAMPIPLTGLAARFR